VSQVINVVLTITLLVVACAKVSTDDTADAIEIWTQQKLDQVAHARHISRAQIWSRRCERKGMDTLATRADKEPWKAHCIERRILTAKAPQ
jgi:predicted hydrolase (HD superfamily)